MKSDQTSKLKHDQASSRSIPLLMEFQMSIIFFLSWRQEKG